MIRKIVIIFVGILWTVTIGGSMLWAEDGAGMEEGFFYDDHDKRDPFWPLVTPSGTITSYETDILVSDLVLEGIISGSGGNNMAIINGLIVKPNDQIGNYTVSAISERIVVLFKGQERFELKLKKEE